MDTNDYWQLRKGRCSEAGRVYLVTAVTSQRLPLFAEWECARAAAVEISAHANWPGAELLCWVLMPDHWHGLVCLAEGGNLAQAVRRAKGSMARAVNLARGRTGTVWQPGYHDRALRREVDLLPAARYVIRNPVRAGLVRSVRDYPYWDAVWL